MVKIGVFDSGFGGLTVLKEIIDKIPQASTEYYADTGVTSASGLGRRYSGSPAKSLTSWERRGST